MTVLGCALGGIARSLGMTLIARLAGERFPWGTLTVNAVGSFLLGLVLGTGLNPEGALRASEGAQAFLAIGFCGGLTTFSTFSLQSFSLVSGQAWGKALSNVLGSVVLCLFCVLSGYALGEAGIG